MPELSTIAVFFVATVALLLAPGPAALYIVARGIDQGRAAGFASAAGIAVGSLVHVAAAAAGLSALLASSAVAFSVVKYLGAAYLIVLGIRTLLTKPVATADANRRRRTMRELFSQGVIVEALNPKVALFFLAFLPQFVDPARGNILGQTLFLGAMFVATGLCTDSLYALVAGSAGVWLRRQPAFAAVQRYVAGTVFIGLGMTTAFSGGETE